MTVTGSEFFGRSREIDELVTMLRNPDIRVVCLFGKSGIGKTKLADEVYAEVFERFQHKVMSPSFRLDLPGQALPGHVEDWLVSSIASKLSKKPMLNPTRNELE